MKKSRLALGIFTSVRICSRAVTLVGAGVEHRRGIDHADPGAGEQDIRAFGEPAGIGELDVQ